MFYSRQSAALFAVRYLPLFIVLSFAVMRVGKRGSPDSSVFMLMSVQRLYIGNLLGTLKPQHQTRKTSEMHFGGAPVNGSPSLKTADYLPMCLETQSGNATESVRQQ